MLTTEERAFSAANDKFSSEPFLYPNSNETKATNKAIIMPLMINL